MQEETRFPLDVAGGLTSEEARRRLAAMGPNRLREVKRESLLEVFLEEVREPMILLLLVTGVLYSIWGKPEDAVTIFAVILALVGVEVWNEHRAERAIASLRELAEPTAPASRDGRVVEVPTEELVPEDAILLAAGRRVPADARLIEAHSLAVDESSLTGESVPVDKAPDLQLPMDTPSAERRNLVFAGSTVTRGRGLAVVVSTGADTELGKIARMAAEVKPPRTPLQRAMDELSRYLVVVALSVSVIVPLLGYLVADQPLKQMVLVGLALAFATIPEEMPIIVTMVLALGGYRLSKRHAIVKRLQAVETLGAITFIATDKTGTLTENRMKVVELSPRDYERRILELGALCSDADAGGSADPMEVALAEAARGSGIDLAFLRDGHRLRDEYSFDDARKLMSVVLERDDDVRVAVKGAPEVVLAASSGRWTARGERPLADDARAAILDEAARMAAEGLRVLAVAEKTAPAPGPSGRDDAEADLVFAGLIGLDDPPRSGAAGAIAACRAAGIRPVMVTGDHPRTAAAVAARVGLGGDGRLLTGEELDTMSDDALRAALAHVSLFARTTPAHKLRIVEAARARGELIAATGDGINDAPALAAADIGVAMGETGTDVAREAADVVLADDDFSTIVRAVEEGRVLFANLRKGVRYYLACKMALVTAMFVPALLGLPLPFAPVQIILMELFMDLAASAAFVAEPAEPGIMRRPPRDPSLPFMDREMVGSIFAAAAGLWAAVVTAYLVTWYSGAAPGVAQTVALVTWLFGHFFLALNLRSERVSLTRLGLLSNRVMTVWGAATVAFVLVAILVPSVHEPLRTVSLCGRAWALAVVAALAGTFWMEVRKWIRSARS